MNWKWEISQFDTEVFGYKVAKITSINAGAGKRGLKIIHQLLEELKKNGIRYATYRVNANNFSVIQNLEESDFLLVDGLITLERNIKSFEVTDVTNVKIAQLSDLKHLEKIAGKVFNVTRYYHDAVIPKSNADMVYKKWVENSLNGKIADKVLVWKENRQALGFITLKKEGYIPLIGVSQKARGKGIGQNLVNAALQTFKDWGLTKVIIETQMTNIPALRVYQSCGFKITDSYLTFRWYDPTE